MTLRNRAIAVLDATHLYIGEQGAKYTKSTIADWLDRKDNRVSDRTIRNMVELLESAKKMNAAR